MERQVIQRRALFGDRFSLLPLDILKHILGLLPIYEAAKFATLSKGFRDAWLGLSRLSFDEHFFRYSIKTYHQSRRDTTKSPFHVIDKLILQHMGHIREFILVFSYRQKHIVKHRSVDVDRWLNCITQQGVQQILLFFGHREYLLPDCVFSCSTLRRLHLFWLCVPPQTSSFSLPNLTSLYFDHVDFGSREDSVYPVHVPKLESLTFVSCTDILNCDIALTNLRRLKIKNCSSSPSRLQLCNVTAFRFDVTSICYLELANKDLREYAVTRLLRELPSLHVRVFKLLDFCYIHDDRLLHWLVCFANAQCYAMLILDINVTEVLSSNLSQFRMALQAHRMPLSLKLREFAGLRSQMEFIQEILACVPALEKFTIIHYSTIFDWNKEHEIKERISHFPCASAKAKIVYQ